MSSNNQYALICRDCVIKSKAEISCTASKPCLKCLRRMIWIISNFCPCICWDIIRLTFVMKSWSWLTAYSHRRSIHIGQTGNIMTVFWVCVSMESIAIITMNYPYRYCIKILWNFTSRIYYRRPRKNKTWSVRGQTWMCHMLLDRNHNSSRQYVSIHSPPPWKARCVCESRSRFWVLTCLFWFLFVAAPPNTNNSPFKVAEQER